MGDSESEPVQVFVRVRPEQFDDTGRRSPTRDRCVYAIDEKTLKFSPPDAIYGSRKGVPAVDDKIYTFDAIFDENATQEAIYERVRSNVKATVKGYNTTIFAYGSTGSGKSHTMTGTTAYPGVIPRAISEVFSFIEASAAQESDVYFYVRISYVELYNNNFRNLLEFASKELKLKDREDERDNFGHGLKGKNKIEVRESTSAGVFLAGPNLRIPVTTAPEAFQLISRGNKSRSVGATQCNDVSSRSHAILTVHVESRLAAKDGAASELRLGKMHLVDLAGSERVNMSGAEGGTLVETQSINLSLSAIGDVLSALSRYSLSPPSSLPHTQLTHSLDSQECDCAQPAGVFGVLRRQVSPGQRPGVVLRQLPRASALPQQQTHTSAQGLARRELEDHHDHHSALHQRVLAADGRLTHVLVSRQEDQEPLTCEPRRDRRHRHLQGHQ